MSEIGSILKLVRFLLAITVLALVAAVTFSVIATQPSDVKDEVLRLKAELRAIKVTIDENAKQLGENKENLAELRDGIETDGDRWSWNEFRNSLLFWMLT